MKIRIKRVYEKASKNDGVRILVDRMWPRGMSKEDAHVDQWMKDIAPSTSLRKWFDHKEERFQEFAEKYKKELQKASEPVQEILDIAKNKTVTLVYGAKDEKHNQAVVLKNFLEEQ